MAPPCPTAHLCNAVLRIRDLDPAEAGLAARIDSLAEQLTADFRAGFRSHLLWVIAVNAASFVLIAATLKIG